MEAHEVLEVLEQTHKRKIEDYIDIENPEIKFQEIHYPDAALLPRDARGTESDIFECPLCHLLLFEPITTSCGHTFCRSCILRAMDHDNKCPICRTTVHISPEHGVAILLKQLIEKSFPMQYQNRKDEVNKDLKEQHFNLPLFMLGEVVLFPKMALPLHIFEPKYKLMMRRCMDGGRRFGVVPRANGGLGEIGTTAVIENHYMFPDGRSLLATLGDLRFKVLESHEVDGYRVAKVEYFSDNDLPTDPEKLRVLDEKFQKMKEMVAEKFKDVGEGKKEVEQKYGKMPTTDVQSFSWWLSAVLPMDGSIKCKLLGMRDVEERLDYLFKFLKSLEVTSSCTIS